MQPENKSAVVLWTGGKDCNLALYEAKSQGYEIIALISFDIGNSRFRAHPLSILERLLSLGFRFIFSCVKEPWFTSDWLGRKIDHGVISELKEIHTLKGLDICGEQGEYHSLVLDGPLYSKQITFDSFTQQKNESLMYLEIENISLKTKK